LKAEAIYIRTHGSWGPGQQTKRGYDWGERDPSERVFGMKGNSIALNGVSKDISDVLKGGDNEPPPGIIKKVVRYYSDCGLPQYLELPRLVRMLFDHRYCT
jgi:hypothetical protein